MSKKAEPMWHPASEKPTDEHAYYAVLVESCGERYIYFGSNYYEHNDFRIWVDQGYGDYWWSPIEEKVIGWMNQKDLEEYLISLHI